MRRLSLFQRPPLFQRLHFANGPFNVDGTRQHAVFDQADAFCRHRDARLPTDAEWAWAARGGAQTRAFPWGAERATAANVNACAVECRAWFERRGRQRRILVHDGDDGWPTTAEVGKFPAGIARWGQLDLAGNVAEWVFEDSRALEQIGEASAAPIEAALRRDTWKQFRVIGASALSGPQYAPETALELARYDGGKKGFSDVGFRLAFTTGEGAGGSAKLGEQLARMLRSTAYLSQ